MTSERTDVCEVQADGAWQTVTIAEAFSKYRDAAKRCPACHGAVIVLAAYQGGSRPRFAHIKAHSGCPLKAASFSGTPSLHPEALS